MCIDIGAKALMWGTLGRSSNGYSGIKVIAGQCFDGLNFLSFNYSLL